MSELIKITERESFGEQIQTVNARDLHGFLEVKSLFANWISDRISQFNFEEEIDFVVFFQTENNPSGGRPAKEYHLSIDMAKELSMVERNEKGKQARKYFIECENRYKQSLVTKKTETPTEILARAVLVAQEEIRKIEEKLTVALPKAEVYDQCMSAEEALDMGVVAKMYGLGRNTLFTLLRGNDILMSNNVPYQAYAHHFKVIEKPRTDSYGKTHVDITTKVRQSGIQFIGKKIGKITDTPPLLRVLA